MFWKLFYKLGLIAWLLWSKLIYRPFLGGRGSPVRGYESLGDLQQVLLSTKWVQDGLKEAGDAVAAAERFQYLLDHGEDPKSGRDCEDTSVYAYVSGNKTPGSHEVLYIVTVSWLVDWFWCFRRPKGHSVCVYYDEADSALHHMGNWGVYPKGNVCYNELSDLAIDVWRNSSAYTNSSFYGYATWKPYQSIPKTNLDFFNLLPR